MITDTNTGYMLMATLPILYGLILAIVGSSMRDDWLGYPKEVTRRRWRIFWLTAGGIFVGMEGLAFFGLGLIPLMVIGAVVGIVVVGGFLAVMFGIGR